MPLNKLVGRRKTLAPTKQSAVSIASVASVSVYSQESCPRTYYWNEDPPPPVPPLPPLTYTAPLRIEKAEPTRVQPVNSGKGKPDAPDSVRGMSIFSGLDFGSEDSFSVEEHANRSSSLMKTPPQMFVHLASTSTSPPASRKRPATLVLSEEFTVPASACTPPSTPKKPVMLVSSEEPAVPASACTPPSSAKKPAKLILPNKSVVPAHLATTSNCSKADVDSLMLIPTNLSAEPPHVCRPYHRPSSRPLPSLPANVYDTSPVILTSDLFQSPLAVHGTKFDDGSVMGKYVCGFAFTESAILDWIERHKLACNDRHLPAERIRRVWGGVLADLYRRCGIKGAMVRVPQVKSNAKQKQVWDYGRCIVMATNEREEDMELEKFSRRRMEEVHMALFCKWGVLGRPEWYEWLDDWK